MSAIHFTIGLVGGISLPVRTASEGAWAALGALLAGAFIVGIDSFLTRALAYRRRGDRGRDWETATAAVRGLLAGDDDRSAEFSEMLRRPGLRRIAIDALTNEARSNPEVMRCLRGRDGDVECIGMWVDEALADKDPSRRSYACEVVAMIRLRTGRGSMLAAVSDEDATVRMAACRSLAVIDPEATVGVLLGMVETEGPWAASLLGDVVQRLPQNAVESVVRRATEWGASPALVRLLASMPNGGADNLLLGSLEDDDPGVRARSAEAIDATSSAMRDALIGLLTDPDEATRLGAVRSLTRSADTSSVLALFAVLSDSSRIVRLAAAEGLARIPDGVALLERTRGLAADPAVHEAAELALWRVEAERAEGLRTPGGARQPVSELLIEAALAESLATAPATSTASIPAPRPARPVRSSNRARSARPAEPAHSDRPAKPGPARRYKAKAGTAVTWLRDELLESGGRVDASSIRASARAAGISSSALDRARRELADIHGVGTKAVWIMRESADQEPVGQESLQTVQR